MKLLYRYAWTHPNRTQPGEHERPTGRPSSQVGCGSKDPRRVVSSLGAPYRQRNDRSEDEHKVHDHKCSLKLTHDLAEATSEYAVTDNAGKEDGIYNAMRRRPSTVSCQNGYAQEHE